MRVSGFDAAFATILETADVLRGKAVSARELLALTYQRFNAPPAFAD